ncbi:uncharacterized protein V6R79_011833 [Siganus canaliculatus]
MMSPPVISGACLLALLIVQTCCFPHPGKELPGGGDPTSFNDPYANNAPGLSPPGSAVYNAPAGVPYQPAPAAAAPVFYQPAEASVGSYIRDSPGGPVEYSSPGFSQPGGSSNFGPSWSVPPLGASSRAESPSSVSPLRPPHPPHPPQPRPPPQEPSYQAGELSQYERNIEDGVYETETEEQGKLPPPPPPPPMFPYGAGRGYTSQPRPPRPPPPFYGGWGFFPYYNYRLLYGQYPPGTYTHVSSDFEHGNDHWQDAHYERYDAPYGSDPGQQTEPFTSGGGGAAADPQLPQVPRQPVNYQGYPRLVGPSGVVWPGQAAPPAHGHTGGSNVVKAN